MPDLSMMVGAISWAVNGVLVLLALFGGLSASGGRGGAAALVVEAVMEAGEILAQRRERIPLG